jgi:hypothetical protein
LPSFSVFSGQWSVKTKTDHCLFLNLLTTAYRPLPEAAFLALDASPEEAAFLAKARKRQYRPGTIAGFVSPRAPTHVLGRRGVWARITATPPAPLASRFRFPVLAMIFDLSLLASHRSLLFFFLSCVDHGFGSSRDPFEPQQGFSG